MLMFIWRVKSGLEGDEYRKHDVEHYVEGILIRWIEMAVDAHRED